MYYPFPQTISATYPRAVSTTRRRANLFSAVVDHLLSIENAFLLFLLSGLFKPLPMLREFPIDFTLLFLCLTLAGIAVASFHRRIRMYPINAGGLAVMLFALFALVSLCWSSGDAANFDKATRFLLLTVPAFFIAQLIGCDADRRLRFARLLLWFSFLLVMYYFGARYVLGIQIEPGQLTDNTTLGDHYLEHGYNAQVFITICLVIASFAPSIYVFPALFGAGFGLYMLTSMNGRGPLIGAGMALALLALGACWRYQRWSRRFMLLFMFLVVAATGYAILEQPLSADDESVRTLWRLQAQITGEDTSSMDERKGGRALAMHMWLEAPAVGDGLGEFVVRDRYLRYPHNLPLEVLSELGAVGGMLFGVVVLVALRNFFIVRNDRNADWAAIALALIFLVDLILHCWVKGYLADDRLFFAYTGLLVGYRRGSS